MPIARTNSFFGKMMSFCNGKSERVSTKMDDTAFFVLGQLSISSALLNHPFHLKSAEIQSLFAQAITEIKIKVITKISHLYATRVNSIRFSLSKHKEKSEIRIPYLFW